MKKQKNKGKIEIKDYDRHDSTAWIDPAKPMNLADLGFELPKESPSQVISLRLPTELLNALRSLGAQKDVPYQSLVKLFLWEKVKKELVSRT